MLCTLLASFRRGFRILADAAITQTGSTLFRIEFVFSRGNSSQAGLKLCLPDRFVAMILIPRLLRALPLGMCYCYLNCGTEARDRSTAAVVKLLAGSSYWVGGSCIVMPVF